MKRKKLLDKLAGILSAEQQAQQVKYKSLKKVLKALRAEKSRLKKELHKTRDRDGRDYIESRLRVISVQRKKGLRLLKDLREERKKKD